MLTQTILYAEDDSNDVFLLTRALRKLGFQNPIQHVQDGAVAISYLTGSNGFSDRTKYPLPSVLLLDLKMPVKDGFEVLEWLRSHPAFEKLPVVVLSSSDLGEDKGKAQELGATAYLTKSFDWTQVFTAIHQVLRASEPHPCV
jgi:CheY-like chemotaxis protein